MIHTTKILNEIHVRLSKYREDYSSPCTTSVSIRGKVKYLSTQ